MDKTINEWLQECQIINDMAIHIEELDENVENLALQRAGYTEMSLKYVTDKGWRRMYQYVLLLKNYSESDLQRLNNHDWLDKLSNWIVEQKRNNNYPILEQMKVNDITTDGALTYQTNEDNTESIYSLNIYFEIRGGE